MTTPAAAASSDGAADGVVPSEVAEVGLGGGDVGAEPRPGAGRGSGGGGGSRAPSPAPDDAPAAAAGGDAAASAAAPEGRGSGDDGFERGDDGERATGDGAAARPRRPPSSSSSSSSPEQKRPRRRLLPARAASSLSAASRARREGSSPSTSSEGGRHGRAAALREEYGADHSCSTPLERLARDVGTALRRWHLGGGCDRHVPLDWKDRMERLEERAIGGDGDAMGEVEGAKEGGEGIESGRKRGDGNEGIEGKEGRDAAVGEDEKENDGVGNWEAISPLRTMESASPSSQHSQASSKPPSPSKCMSMALCERGFADRRRIKARRGEGGDLTVPEGIAVRRSDGTYAGLQRGMPQSPPPPRPKVRPPSSQPSLPRSDPDLGPGDVFAGARCIRMQKIRFQTTGYAPHHDDDDESESTQWNRRRYTVPLVLKLWDAPRHPSSDADDGIASGGDGAGADVPLSLRPKASPSAASLLGELRSRDRARPSDDADGGDGAVRGSDLATGLTRDLSTLFGIGQHVTLALDAEAVAARGGTDGGDAGSEGDDVGALCGDVRAYLDELLREALEARGRARRERGRRREREERRRRQARTRRRAGPRESEGAGVEGSCPSTSREGEEERATFDDGMHVEDDDAGSPKAHDPVSDMSLDHRGRDSDDESHDGDSADDSLDDSSAWEEDGHLDLDRGELHQEVVASLAGILQMALNLAASENDCRVPVFGIWGDYRGDGGAEGRGGGSDNPAAPRWIPAGLEEDLLHATNHTGGGEGRGDDSGRVLLSSPVLSGTCRSDALRSSHRAYFVPSGTLPLHLSTLNGLANVLLAQCPPPRDDSAPGVVLAAARHCYRWDRSEEGGHRGRGRGIQGWREVEGDGDGATSEVEAYRERCRKQAVHVLERASSPWSYGPPAPMWGPGEGDPLLSLSAAVSLPNLGYVPGLDDAGGEDVGVRRGREACRGLRGADARVLGHRASHAAFVNSSEPDPDREQCIINQKLQITQSARIPDIRNDCSLPSKVYNICIECKMSTEALYEKRMRNDHEHDDSIMNSEGSMLGRQSGSEDDDEFFDTEEVEQTVSFEPCLETRQDTPIEEMLMRQATVMGPLSDRIGARCPVPDGMPLVESGDQLYAPYLQRTMPMTDEEEQKQKKFLGVSKNTTKEERPSIRSRITIAQRLQKPKLLSDMSSFKAANREAVFEDFVRWYGNPDDPLHEEVDGEAARLAYERRSNLPPDEAKTLALEEASEAIAILMSLRAFWEDTWAEAVPLPAFEQEPLFDPHSTVEMVLHSFETIHPALLMNQVLATMLMNARFVLEASAEPAQNIRSVERGLASLRTTVDSALSLLARDAAEGFFRPAPRDADADPLLYASTSTITRCEEACNVIGELEILLTRALSLLRRYPGEHALVDTLLSCRGRFVSLKRPRERNVFTGIMKLQQEIGPNAPSHEASPSMREYVLRNCDPTNPCQLSVRLVPNLEEDRLDSLFQGSLLLALTTCRN
ncbi:hypothetical protein ACHAWF_013009 [Thalassiosira exigua]